MSKNKYVLITPVKNEEQTIKQVIDSVKEQSIKPDLWIIVNDGSTDKTESILKKETRGIKWIKVLNKKINRKYNWLGYSKVIREGISLYDKLLNQRSFKKVSYLGILDSDITIETQYFERILKEFDKDKNLGVVSGEVYIQKQTKWVPEFRGNHPRGGARLYYYPFLKDIGGFPDTPSPDRISDIKIQTRGHKIMKLSSTKAFQHRASSARDNKLKGYFKQGRGKYILNYNLVHTLLISVKVCFRKKPYIFSGIFFFLGYFSGFFSKDKKINDKEIKEFSKNFWKRIFK